MISLFVHVFGEWGVALIIKKIPAPMLSIWLSFLMNWETISRRFSQFWYQSNSVEFLGMRGELLSVSFFPEGLFSVVAVLLEIHLVKIYLNLKLIT